MSIFMPLGQNLSLFLYRREHIITIIDITKFIYFYIQQQSGDGLLKMELMVKPALTGKEMMLSSGVTMLWFQTAKIEQLIAQVSIWKGSLNSRIFVNLKQKVNQKTDCLFF